MTGRFPGQAIAVVVAAILCQDAFVLAFIGGRTLKYGMLEGHYSLVRKAAIGSDTDGTRNEGETVNEIESEVDIAIVGAGLGGLCAGAILNTLYNKKVAVFESHYLAGGCAHAFDRKASNGETFTFDSGPTILLGYVGTRNRELFHHRDYAHNETTDSFALLF